MMNVLIFSTAYLPFVGGAEVAVKEITDRLGDQIEFDLITARIRRHLPKTEKVGKVTVYRIGVGVETLDKLLLPFLGAIKVIELNRTRSYSYFWCIMVSFASGGAYIANWFQKKVPIILTLQEGDSEKWLKYRWLGLIDLSWRLALRRTAFLTAISNYLLDRSKRLGFKGECALIPNGVDVEKFENAEYPASNKEGTTLITTSRLVTKNGVGDIIEALKFLPEKVRLKVIGTGPLEESLKSKVKSLRLGTRVDFLGFVPPDKIPAYLHQADIFVRPSLSEGMGNSFIEAMAAGIPAVGTPVGGIPDFLIDGETGLFCEPENPRSIARAVERLLYDPALRLKLCQNGKKLVREKYDWDLIAREMKTRVFDLPAGAGMV